MKEKSLLDKIISNPIIHNFFIYISGGWIILEITEYFIDNFGLQESIRNILLIILLCIFPIIILVSWVFHTKQKNVDKETQMETGQIPPSVSEGIIKKERPYFKKRQLFIPGILIILAIVVTSIFHIHHQSQKRFALNYSLPSLINDYVQQMNNPFSGKNWDIYQKVLGLKNLLKEDPDFVKLWLDITVPLTISSNPTGAKVFGKAYSTTDTIWHFIGKTPTNNIQFPRGLSKIKVEKADFKTQFDVILKQYGWQYEHDTLQYQLFHENEIPDLMVHVSGHLGDKYITPFLPDYYIGSFWMDIYEVTNKDYKMFLDAGGYEDSGYWDNPFIEGIDTIAFADAMKRFIDKTGWIGPANWELSEFPEGAGNLPVTGISWYEAAAYAKFAKKSLPTIFHWIYVSEMSAAPEIVKFGNFNKKGPVEKRTYNSMTRFGTYDLPGNVSEWVYNATGNDRFVLGGNFKEPNYLYNIKLRVSPWKRDELIGFRCIKYINDTLIHKLTQSFDFQKRDYKNLQPVSDATFNIYMDLLKYERVDLNPKTISRTETNDWIREIISVNVPYEEAPMKILVFLPVNFKPPYQAILYFPGIDSHHSSSMINMNVNNNIDFFLKSGRAVIWPVYYASNGRGTTNITNLNLWKQAYKNIISDVHVTLDYLETRSDINPEKIAYFGFSWGGGISPYILATEKRIKLGILALFGIQSIEKYRFKEFDQIDYVPHVKIPMLLLGGRYDPDYTMEQQQAFYDFLGTAKSDKEWMVYESTHYIPRKDLINESLNWLDKYFGPAHK